MQTVGKLNVPGKIKHFLWKSCTNSLPIKENVLKRAIPIDPICHLCSRDNESVLHALWGCEKVQTVWATDFGWVDKNTAVSGSFSDLVQLIKEKPPHVSVVQHHSMVYLAPQKQISPPRAFFAAGENCSFRMRLSQSFKIQGTQGNHSRGSRHPSQKHWCPPPQDCFKTNYDRVMFDESDEVGLGVVIRNSEGQVMAAFSKKIRKPHSVVTLEFLAARRAVVFVSEIGF
ncbi:uncharacterized protein LOC142643931 [Castanea sativa]|uniref:uncharacterized protein LOC142643931 n=1 Tax=Castanea sativa TaxID=21020 RepID=UPI003F64BE87